MRNLPLIITAVIVMSIMLAAALLSRTSRVGPSRSVQFGNDLVINVDSVDSVAVLVEALQPDGTTAPVAWAYLGPVQGASQMGGVTFPAVPLTVTCVIGGDVVQTVGGVQTVLGSGVSLVAGAATPGTALSSRPSAKPAWVTTITPTPGTTWVVRPTNTGGLISSQPVFVPAPPVPPAPIPPAPPSGGGN